MLFCCAPPEDKQPQITITAQEVKPAGITAPPLSEKAVDSPKPQPQVPSEMPVTVSAPPPEAAAPPAPTPAPAPAAAVKVHKNDPFDAVLDKSGGKKLGLALNQEANGGKSLAITQIVAGGLAAEHNAKAGMDQQIWPGSVILAVDGAQGSPAELVKKMGASSKTTLKIQAPKSKDVTIEKKGAGLGLGMKPVTTAKGDPGLGMLITGIAPGGRASEFNEANPTQALKTGETVVQVNGRSDIVEAIKANEPVVLTVTSP